MVLDTDWAVLMPESTHDPRLPNVEVTSKDDGLFGGCDRIQWLGASEFGFRSIDHQGVVL